MGNQSANVSFVPPANTGGLPITEYVAMAFINGQPTGIFQTGTGSPIEVTGLQNGQPYTFEVYAVNAVGIGPWSAPSNVFTPEPTVPSPPLSPAASPGNGSATITFQPPQTDGGSAITGYTATDSTGVYSASVTGYGPITVNGLMNGTAYSFTVVATNAIGNSLPSASVSVTPSGTATVPTAPLNPSAVAGNAQATVTFSPPASTGGAAIQYYDVQAYISGTPSGSPVQGGASPIVVGSLTNGTAYTFTVTATNSVGTGPASVQTTPVTPIAGNTVPGPPTGVAGTPGNAQVVVTFTAPASNGGSVITSYTATSTPGNITASVTGATAQPITVADLTNGQAYTFTVYATNAVGNSPLSTPSLPVTPATVPGTPEMISATAGNASATVTFSPPSSDGGSPITSYTATDTTGVYSGHASESPITVMGLTNGNSYAFNVRATNAIGNGAYNGPSNSVTPSTVPGPPTNFVVTAGNGAVTATFGAPTNTGGLPLGNYTVYSVAPGPTGKSNTGGSSPIIVGALTNGTTYYFQATASNADGTGTPTATSGGVTPATVPSPPQNVSATAGSNQATVTFDAPASDGGAAVQSYSATTTPATTTFSNGLNLSITCTGLTNGTSYTISVRATNTVGPSNPATSNAVTPEPSSTFVISGPAELATGQVGVTYPGSTITESGGVGTITFFNTGNPLPTGLSLNASTGAITGTPTQAGDFKPGFQATDTGSGGGYTPPTSTLIALNQNYDGTPADQLPGGIQTVSSVPLVHGQLWVGLTTIATYGGAHLPPPSLQTLQGDSIALQTYIAGPQMPYINASQETSLFKCDSAVGGTTTFQQWYGPDGYGGNNPGDSDYQAFLAFQYSGTWIGYGAFTAQTGTNYGGVPQGTALTSGPITLSGAQVPCTIYGFCENTSQLGTNYTPTPNSISGIAPNSGTYTTWNFAGTQSNTSCYASWNITSPGTYTPSFNQPSTSLQCSQTVGWAVKGTDSGGGGGETPLVNIPITINPSGGAPDTPSGLQMTLMGQTSPQSNQPSDGNCPPTNGNTCTLTWGAVSNATSYTVLRANSPTGNYTTAPNGSNITGTTYTDSAATNVVGSSAGPVNGQFWPGAPWCYKVQANNGSGSSAPSAQHVVNYCVNPTGPIPNAGNGIGFDYTGTGGTVIYGSSNPWDNNKCVQIQQPNNGYWLPVCGNLLTGWNFPVGAFEYGYLYIDIGITSALPNGAYFEMVILQQTTATDVVLENSSGNQNWIVLTPYAQGPVNPNGWTTYKLPISIATKSGLTAALFSGYGNGEGGALQTWYKSNINCQNAALTYYVNNIILKAT